MSWNIPGRKLQIAIIILATVFAYSNIFNNQFIGDDQIFFVEWQLPKDIKNIPLLLTAQSTPSGHAEGGYRPARAIMFVLANALWGTNLTGYHLFSILVHLINTVLVYLIVGRLGKLGKLGGLIPFAAALLFGVHPIHTEAVTQMIASFDTFGIVFFLASFYFYLRKKYFLSVLLGWVGFFYYEMTLTLPVVLAAFDFCFNRKGLKGKWIKHIIFIYGPYLLGVALFLLLRVGVFHLVSRGGYIENSLYLQMLLASRIFMLYIQTMFIPLGLTMNHTILPGVQVWLDPFTNYQAIQQLSIFKPGIIFNLVFILGAVLTGFKLAKKYPVISFGIFFFFITLFPASNIVPVGVLMQERYSYLASFGFILLISYLGNLRRLGYLVLILAIFYGYLTYQRNFDWKDSISMWSQLTRQLPNHVVTNFQLASMYQEKGDYPQAIKYYQKTLSLEPNIPNAYYQLGLIYLQSGDKSRAKEYFKVVLKFLPNDAQAQEKLK